jgi:hypothetical protein
MKNYGDCDICKLPIIGCKNRLNRKGKVLHKKCPPLQSSRQSGVDQKSNETTCSICLDEMNDSNSSTTQCGHSFHVKCLLKWKNGDQDNWHTCPYCREELNKKRAELEIDNLVISFLDVLIRQPNKKLCEYFEDCFITSFMNAFNDLTPEKLYRLVDSFEHYQSIMFPTTENRLVIQLEPHQIVFRLHERNVTFNWESLSE